MYSTSDAQIDAEGLAQNARHALKLAVNYSLENAEPDGHWYGELRSNATITAQYVFLRQALELDLSSDCEALCRYFLADQKEDGSWGIAPGNYPGDVSVTVEAYLALKILGVPANSQAMHKARRFVHAVGGVEKVRIFTRIYLATFGLFPWTAVPALPAELILIPSFVPVSIYNFASWARSTIVPLPVLSHHQPIYPLPNGMTANNTFLDELWCDPAQKQIPYSHPLRDLRNFDRIAFTFSAIDTILHLFGGLRSIFTRGYARARCIKWILDHQEAAGDWAGIFPPMHFGILALALEGYSLQDPPVKRGIEAIERFAWQDEQGKRIQSCVSPVWDTVLTTISLCDAGLPLDHSSLVRAVSWVKGRQLLGAEGDWRVYRPHIQPGGFSFEYFNTWYPDVDDTAAAILAFLKQDPTSAGASHVFKATSWILGMQNRDGGWAAFDVNNDKMFLNRIPFSDMDSLCDPSSADVTGRVLEAFGLLMRCAREVAVDQRLSYRIASACKRGIGYLGRTREIKGAWYGRWGSNYIYGTSNVLCGLRYFGMHDLAYPAIEWLKSVQNADGGWGEKLKTYRDPGLAGWGQSTASQTAWGLMGLLAYLPHTDAAVQKGVAYLVESQTLSKGEGRTWAEKEYTGTGFPNFFYIGYSLYPHYFPIMTLGRYLQGHKSDRELEPHG
ncbi:MAG: hypothetical protein Q9182_007065 [Xanthomendoza sp. 2 TL-2023]